MNVKIISTTGRVPSYATSGASGFDIEAAENVTINPGHWVRIPTGLFVAIPDGYELQIRSRSGIAYREGLVVHQSVGTIDSDYRGEIFVVLRNVGLHARTITERTRIAQGIVAPYVRVTFNEVDDLPATDRGDGGFGSTGV